MTTVAVVYHSVSGRTKQLADAVARGALAVNGTEARIFEVASVDHDALAAADAIVFGCPTYMGSVSAAFKAFMDATVAVWGLQGWRDKLAAGFTHSAAASGDKLATLSQLAVFAAQHGMLWIPLGLPPTYAATGAGDGDLNRLGSHLGAMAQSTPGSGGRVPESDVRTAEHLGRHVAEAAHRWRRGAPAQAAVAPSARHRTTAYWAFPPSDRAPLSPGVDRINLRELVARIDRFEHHLVVCATTGHVQLEIVTASEPLYFGHVNLSDEVALALPCGDDLVDRFPLFRTFLADPQTGEDIGRYNHRVGDLVLHPQGALHWPGRLRPPYEPFEVPAGMRRCGLSLVCCASERVPSTARGVIAPPERATDVKPYASPPPAMRLQATNGPPGIVAEIGTARLELVDLPAQLAPARGAWVVVLEAAPGSAHFACDLVRIPAGVTLDARGIVRALVLTDETAEPDRPPPTWQALPPPPFAPFEEGPRGDLPVAIEDLAIEAISDRLARVRVGDASAEVPRYWLARMLFRCALHDLRLGYVETYGGFFVDDHAPTSGHVELGLRTRAGKRAIALQPARAREIIERLYRAVAPSQYRERLD